MGPTQPVTPAAENEGVRYTAEQTVAPAEPGQMPKVTIAVTCEISGAFVTSSTIALATRQLALSLTARLREVSEQSRLTFQDHPADPADYLPPESGAITDARATREHMARWAAGDDTHPGEGMIP
jgi:hypothetical protein